MIEALQLAMQTIIEYESLKRAIVEVVTRRVGVWDSRIVKTITKDYWKQGLYRSLNYHS